MRVLFLSLAIACTSVLATGTGTARLGAACAVNADCADGSYCQDQKCGVAAAACRVNAQCLSGSCVNGACADGPAPTAVAPGKIALGGACVDSHQCTNGAYCYEQQCGPPKALCNVNAQCLSGTCAMGVCAELSVSIATTAPIATVSATSITAPPATTSEASTTAPPATTSAASTTPVQFTGAGNINDVGVDVAVAAAMAIAVLAL